MCRIQATCGAAAAAAAATAGARITIFLLWSASIAAVPLTSGSSRPAFRMWGGRDQEVCTVGRLCERSRGEWSTGFNNDEDGYALFPHSRPPAHALLAKGYKAAVTGLRLRGGKMGPHAKLTQTSEDIMVHHKCTKLPRPDHSSVRSALHRSRKETWNGRRIFVKSSVPMTKDEDDYMRYSWRGLIRIGDMPGGTGNHTVARISGDDEAQLWGKWHFQGTSIGIFQGLYTMYMTYGPYKPLIVVTGASQVLFEQCEVRNFGGKCIVAQGFSEVTLDWCTVGGSAGSLAPDHHKKFQVWDPNSKGKVAFDIARRKLLRQKRGQGFLKKKERGNKIDWSKHWAPGWARFASDGVSVESGSWLFAHRVCFEDTGRIHGVAVRGVGHAIITLEHCRFQRNRIHLASDATVQLSLRKCTVMLYDKDKLGTAGYHGDLTEFKATRSLRLPGNGTSILESQQPTTGKHLVWREVTPTNRYWKLGMEERGVDPARQRKRIEQRAERKRVRDALRARGVDASKYIIHASHQDFAPFNRPATKAQKTIAKDDDRRHSRNLRVFGAPETIKGSPWEGEDAGIESIDPGPKPGERYWDDELGIGVSSESNQVNSDPTVGRDGGETQDYYDDDSDTEMQSGSGDDKWRPGTGGGGALGDTVSSSD